MFIFVDADTIVNEAVVRSAVEALRSGAVGGGAAVEFDEAVPLYARLLMQVLVRLFRAASVAAGCFLFCTRSAFMAVGGFCYTAGGVVYALRKPNPSPRWFGFHEVFHALTVAGFICQYIAASFVVYRAA